MPHAPTPWVGLAALAAMFVIPFLPSWIFEGPRTVRHRPQRHICGDCQAPVGRGLAVGSGGGLSYARLALGSAAIPPSGAARLQRITWPSTFADHQGKQRSAWRSVEDC